MNLLFLVATWAAGPPVPLGEGVGALEGHVVIRPQLSARVETRSQLAAQIQMMPQLTARTEVGAQLTCKIRLYPRH